jgi:thymidylate synthase
MNLEEKQYLNQLENVINNGLICDDRTGVGTKSLFGCQMRFRLDTHFPLLTTKKMFTKGIIEELLWFLRGDTDSKKLEDKGVKIWVGNTSRQFLDKLGFTERREGDGGPIYGFNFRHFGGQYVDCDTDYTGVGYDQVAEVLRLLKEEPNSRRIIINLWNPLVLDDMVLPPCHVLYQFRVYGNKLSCSMYQRSGDMGLGVPFNIASGSLMTYIFAKLSNLEPYEFIHTIGDSHIYLNHEEVLKEQITREPKVFPNLKIVDRGQKKVEDFVLEDFVFENYVSHSKINMEMAV